MPVPLPTHIERLNPILRVEDMGASVRYYTDVLGFTEADWGDGDLRPVCGYNGSRGLDRHDLHHLVRIPAAGSALPAVAAR
jgi:catechol 2,3-dioxygenase-like lactoylglutathione lyase family enzyme